MPEAVVEAFAVGDAHGRPMVVMKGTQTSEGLLASASLIVEELDIVRHDGGKRDF